jgi:hypothetical protein
MPTTPIQWWARRKRAFAHPTENGLYFAVKLSDCNHFAKENSPRNLMLDSVTLPG